MPIEFVLIEHNSIKMKRKLIQILIHPLLIYSIIVALECIPYHPNAKKIVLHEMPKAGDNFGTLTSEAVYYYSGKGKYGYTSPECYFSYVNPTFDISYKDGGIKTIDAAIADKIPLLGSMCDDQKKVEVKMNTSRVANFFSTNFLLDHFSGLSHIVSYLILSFSVLYRIRLRKGKYWLTFVIVFMAGSVLEFVQMFFIEGRHASFEDQFSNCIGALVAIFIFQKISKSNFYNKIA